jgi:hypothetical protein
MVQIIQRTLWALLLSAAFLGPAQAVGINIGVDINFWGEPAEYRVWCNEYYSSCVAWEQLPPEWRVRYQEWWGHRHPHEHWGKGPHKEHEHEHHGH